MRKAKTMKYASTSSFLLVPCSSGSRWGPWESGSVAARERQASKEKAAERRENEEAEPSEEAAGSKLSIEVAMERSEKEASTATGSRLSIGVVARFKVAKARFGSRSRRQELWSLVP